MSTFGSIWPNRSATARTPKSGEHDDQMAPRLAVARNATRVCGQFGACQNLGGLLVPEHTNEIRDRAPEIGEPGHREAPQLVVVRGLDLTLGAQPVAECLDPASSDLFGGRTPEHFRDVSGIGHPT